jgi:hypothetical protein
MHSCHDILDDNASTTSALPFGNHPLTTLILATLATANIAAKALLLAQRHSVQLI